MTPLADLTYADAYFADSLNLADWESYTYEQQNIALNTATRLINNLAFKGYKTDEDQENEYPRNDEDTPEAIQSACSELALALLKDHDLDSQNSQSRVTSESIDNKIKVSYDTNTIQEHIRHGIISYQAWLYLKPYLIAAGTINLIRV